MHKEISITERPREYNCEDCPFQGNNGLELKKHVQRTKHNPSEYLEKCYSCKKEFTSYWHLMNHRKSEHPSSKACRFFLTGKCIFDSEACWFKHVIKTSEELVKDNSSAFPCNQCESVFDSKMDIMKHLKAIHKCKVAKCRNFEQGNCNLPDLSCWFVHDEEEIKSNLSNHINNDHEQVFQKAQEKTPPDHIVKIMDLIGKLTIQMDQLEKRTMQQ